VIKGTLSGGRAHGDGVTRENQSFDLLPSYQWLSNFGDFYSLNNTKPEGDFVADIEFNAYPFLRSLRPLDPVRDPIALASFSIGFRAMPSISTQYPLFLNPVDNQVDFGQGIIIDVPVRANVTEAYIVLSGPAIVPEPSMYVIGTLSIVGLAVIGCMRRRNALSIAFTK
jgi:hypothetical protein